MKTLKHKIATCGFLGVSLLLGTTACSDDHFDVKSGIASSSNTIWQNIQSTQELDSLAMILSRTIVMKDENDKRGKLTYAELLNQANTFTVWAPKNGTYNAQKYLEMLNERDALLKQSDDTLGLANKRAWELNYIVGNQLLQNHIANFNFASSTSDQKVRMLNTKLSVYNGGTSAFNNIPTEENIISSNGALHMLNGQSPFIYNIYDYMATSPSFSELWAVISDPAIDKREWSQNGSTPGAMDENGKMVYIDSSYIHTNLFLDRTGASIKDEDSLYVAILPANGAVEAAIKKVEGLYNYGNSYFTSFNSNTGDFINKADKGIVLNASQVDSLRLLNAKSAIITSAYFSSTNWPIADKHDSVQVNHYAQTADSLRSTANHFFYNSNRGGVNPMFNAQAPIKASNGYIYPLTTYAVDPAYSLVSRREIDLRNDFFVVNSQGMETAGGTKGQIVYLNEDNRNDSVKGEVEDNAYRRFPVSGSSNMLIDIRLDDLYSTKYTIKAVMVPNNINVSNIRTERDRKTGEEKPIEEKATFTCELRMDDQMSNSATIDKAMKTSTFKLLSDSVETVTLFENIQIPKCYVGLPSGSSETFMVLRFSMTRLNQNSGKCKSLNIRKIIIEPVRE